MIWVLDTAQLSGFKYVQSTSHSKIRWIGLRENLQETIKSGVSCKFSRHPILWKIYDQSILVHSFWAIPQWWMATCCHRNPQPPSWWNASLPKLRSNPGALRWRDFHGETIRIIPWNPGPSWIQGSPGRCSHPSGLPCIMHLLLPPSSQDLRWARPGDRPKRVCPVIPVFSKPDRRSMEVKHS